MSSKLVSLLALLSLAGCSLKLNDPVTKKTHMVNTGAGCLSQAGDVLDRFTKGKLSEAEHDSFYACLDKALTTFALHADGKQRDYFEPGELGNFLTRYFLKGKPIQPGLVREATELKRAFIGGAGDRITREELRRIIALFGVFKQATARLRPVMPIRADSLISRGYNSEQFEDAIARFTGAIALVGDSIRNDQQAYKFDNLANLVRELRAFLYPDGVPEDHWTSTMLKVSEVIRPAKVIFVSPPRDEIAAADWPRIYRLAPRYYASYLRAQFYLGSALSSFSVQGLDRVERFFTDFVNIFEFVLDQHDDKAISSAEIDDFLGTLHAQGMLPCKPDTAKAFLKAVFGKLLGGPAASHDFAINKDSLNRFKENLRFALEGFHAIAHLYKLSEGAPGPLHAGEIERVPTDSLLRATRKQSGLSLEAVEALKRTPREVRTVFAGDTTTVHIPQGLELPPVSHFHLLKVHGLRSVNRLLMQAYGTPGKEQLSEEQLGRFLDDIFPILKELGLADDGLRESIVKRLFEASLFLYSSDGDKSLTMAEAIELESLMISTLMHSPRAHKEIADACKVPWPKGSKRPVPAACYQSQFLAGARRHWDYIPGLASFFMSKPGPERSALFASMATFLRKGKAEGEDFTVSDTQAFTLLPYYIELLFSRFDTNRDGLLDNEEGDMAYPVFQPFLAKKAAEKGIHDPKTHKAIFNFLLAYRQLPDDDKVGFVLRRYLLGAKSFEVDRGHVVEIFSKLLSL